MRDCDEPWNEQAADDAYGLMCYAGEDQPKYGDQILNRAQKAEAELAALKARMKPHARVVGGEVRALMDPDDEGKYVACWSWRNDVSIEAYPLQWPDGWKRASYRKAGRFSVTFARARDELLTEIKRLNGRLPVISSNMRLRQDGIPYAQQTNIQDPGIAVYFTYKGKQMCFACDKYTKVEANMRAIQLTISAIRGIERWVASDMMERAFTGFAALEHRGEDWWDVLEVRRDASREVIEGSYRRKRSEHHPDKGGDPMQFQRVQRAYEAATK